MLDKTFRPDEVEQDHYQRWESEGAFACGQRPGAPTYTIVIPPPNVTGSLHVGHALDNTLQDILIRFARMRGFDTLWQPGTDHAGIATQMVVERQLAEEGKTRHDLGREGFIDRVWKWKAESGGTITAQLRRLGASCDWSRERFTMDDGLSDAVRKVFVELYRKGLIYKDKRLVNWDCALRTAISDLEVEQREILGHMWHFKYPVEGLENTYITVATTRPETMLGDTAVAVHPDDERYTDLVGKNVILPLVGRQIPIVADDYSDPEKGTGAVKITPAHDFNDFEVGRRHDLPLVNVFDEQGCMTDDVPEAYRGMDRADARKKVVADLDALGLVAEVEDHVLQVPYGDRSGTVIEPWLTDQWYADAETLAKPAIEAVETGKTKFIPGNWEKTYFQWMRNIQPWCISRQLWWGHQIPAWYTPDGSVYVAETEAEAMEQAVAAHGNDITLERDPDVLDTWFSSGLWPFSTLGWPEETPEVERFYPTSVLVTGFDIIFFWVARMMMMGLHFMDEVPFREIYIHALVRDAKGQKMSKSKGNVMDPLVLIDKYGADAVRFTLAAMEAQGRDIKLAENRIEGYRNFATKLWNAARFCEMNGCRRDQSFDPASCERAVDKWIVGKLVETQSAVTKSLEAFRYNDAANAIYQFTWGTFCDWYVEFIKPYFGAEDGPDKTRTQNTAAWVIDQILALLHPFMPFVTEELWDRLAESSEIKRDTMLILAPWPDHPDSLIDPEVVAEVDWLMELISKIREVRSEMNVPGGAKIPMLLTGGDSVSEQRLVNHNDVILRLARLETATVSAEIPAGSAQIVHGVATVVLPLADVIDLDQEKARLTKARGKLEDEIGKIDKKLANESFLAKAPEAVIDEQKTRRGDAEAAVSKLSEALDRLSATS
jgi:valyl-tRNA synthetase